MSRILLLSVLMISVLLSGLVSGPARAAMDPSGTSALKTLFTKYIDDRKAAARQNGQELRTEGDIKVEPKDTYYAVTLPHMSSHQPDGSYTDIGIISINATPGNDSKTWKMSVAAPTPIIAYDAQKQPSIRIDIGGQTFNGIWHNDLENFQKLDARYTNVTMQEFSQGITAKIPTVTAVYDINPGPNGWSGNMTYTADQMEVTAKGDPAVSKVGKIMLQSQMSDFNPADLKTYREKIAAMPKGQNDDNAQGLYNLVADFMGSAVGQFSSRLSVDAVDLHRAAPTGVAPGKLTLRQAVISMDGKGFRENNVASNVKINFDGLNITPAPAGIGETIPNKMLVDVELTKIPFKTIMDLGRQSFGTSGTDQNAAIRQALGKAGATMKINPSSMGNTMYNIALNGQMVANATTSIGMDGKARAEITGLNALVALAQSRIKDKTVSAEEKQKLAGITLGLTTLQMMGQADKANPGKDFRIYDVVITPDGKIMLNGNDLAAVQALMGLGMPKTP